MTQVGQGEWELSAMELAQLAVLASRQGERLTLAVLASRQWEMLVLASEHGEEEEGKQAVLASEHRFAVQASGQVQQAVLASRQVELTGHHHHVERLRVEQAAQILELSFS